MKWPISSRILVLLAAFCSLACANTEIRHFKPTREPTTIKSTETSLTQAGKDAIAVSLVPNLTPLTGPYETVEFEKIAYQQSTNSTNKERWYSLRDLAYGKTYELRVSYAATTPSDFEITLFSFDELLAHYGKPPSEINRITMSGSATNSEEMQSTYTVMYSRVTALYSGVSTVPGLENQQVSYMLTLEKHVLGLPVQALWLILVLVVVIFAAIFIVAPRVLSTIDGIIEEEKLDHQKSN
ncbi:hypothetical protein IW140_004525 [Coemansia sp. RSA 1813]|nr:hypothetical protein EV178_004662 [Coemansia sp. RSA 1646]KAJ1771186.1 hypothetical protein LPJ74_002576 [Coemansia sp. RSA 1843]KAJ2087790.1 hypothetical protein IW138_004684 [Coemansia sp. RSA 986]KAJ2212685.1 hypothetical protein EV179_004432 [Coemansia sp. RSA 487]KAJ2567391.1 hypothetical protein IW140_004525 [Coemansia sp. RSA 1813]